MRTIDNLTSNEYRTKSQIVLDRLRDAIISGALIPGQKIPQDEIAASMEISRIPLREAFQKLEEQGFVTIIPHHGVIVTPLSTNEIKEVYLIRLNLELLATRAAAERIDPIRLKQLREILDEAHTALASQDHERLSRLNREFHQIAYDSSALPLLCRLISDLRAKCERYRLMHSNLPNRPQVALEEHEKMLQAWANHDPDAAEKWTRINMANSAKAVLSAVDSSEDLAWADRMVDSPSPLVSIA